MSVSLKKITNQVIVKSDTTRQVLTIMESHTQKGKVWLVLSDGNVYSTKELEFDIPYKVEIEPDEDPRDLVEVE